MIEKDQYIYIYIERERERERFRYKVMEKESTLLPGTEFNTGSIMGWGSAGLDFPSS